MMAKFWADISCQMYFVGIIYVSGQSEKKPFWHTYMRQFLGILNGIDWIFIFLKGIQKHNFDAIKIYWYNHLVFIRTGCKIETTEKKKCNMMIQNMLTTWQFNEMTIRGKNQNEKNMYKLFNQYLEGITLKNKSTEYSLRRCINEMGINQAKKRVM